MVLIGPPPRAAKSESEGSARNKQAVPHASARDAVIPRKLISNRVAAIALHASHYAFQAQARIARDSGVSPATVSRLMRGVSHPSLLVALRVTHALSRRVGKPLNIFEVFSYDGTYPTSSVCEVASCPSCLPPDAYDENEELRPEFEGQAGRWSQLPSLATAAAKGGK